MFGSLDSIFTMVIIKFNTYKKVHFSVLNIQLSNPKHSNNTRKNSESFTNILKDDTATWFAVI